MNKYEVIQCCNSNQPWFQFVDGMVIAKAESDGRKWCVISHTCLHQTMLICVFML